MYQMINVIHLNVPFLWMMLRMCLLESMLSL